MKALLQTIELRDDDQNFLMNNLGVFLTERTGLLQEFSDDAVATVQLTTSNLNPPCDSPERSPHRRRPAEAAEGAAASL